jgi:hypothetical protein
VRRGLVGGPAAALGIVSGEADADALAVSASCHDGGTARRRQHKRIGAIGNEWIGKSISILFFFFFLRNEGAGGCWAWRRSPLVRPPGRSLPSISVVFSPSFCTIAKSYSPSFCTIAKS